MAKLKRISVIVLSFIIVSTFFCLAGCTDKGLSTSTNYGDPAPWFNIGYTSEKSKIKIGEDLTINLRVFLIYDSEVSTTVRIALYPFSNPEEEKVITDIENFEAEWQDKVVIPSEWFIEGNDTLMIKAYACYLYEYEGELREDKGEQSIPLHYIVEGNTIKLFDFYYKYEKYIKSHKPWFSCNS